MQNKQGLDQVVNTLVSGSRGQGFDPHSLQCRSSFSSLVRTRNNPLYDSTLVTYGRYKAVYISNSPIHRHKQYWDPQPMEDSIGNYFTLQCRNVIWLPGSISEATVTPTVCVTCTPGPIFKIQFTFRRLEIPPHFNIHHLGCVGGCDDVMRELIEISGFGRHNFTRAPATGRGTTAPSRNDPQNNQQRTRGRGTTAPLRNGSQNNPQQNTCSFCHQTGHSSSDCYSGTSQNRSSRFQRVNTHDGDPTIPCTTCGSPCSLKTANTDANRGRKFYSCQAQGCKFFVCWEDSVPATRGGGSYSNNASTSAANTSGRGGRGGGRANSSDVRFVSATGDPVSGRSCFICGDPSHFANVCPTRVMRN